MSKQVAIAVTVIVCVAVAIGLIYAAITFASAPMHAPPVLPNQPYNPVGPNQ
jgi:hypothetical protein